jgi:hypothetical protein
VGERLDGCVRWWERDVKARMTAGEERREGGKGGKMEVHILLEKFEAQWEEYTMRVRAVLWCCRE